MNSMNSQEEFDLLKADKIIDASASVYGVPREKVIGKSRLGRYVHARHSAMKLTRDETRLSHKEIASMYSGRDHSTVVGAVKKIEGYLQYDQSYRNEYNALVKRYHEMMMAYKQEVIDMTAEFEHVTDFLDQ